MTHRIGLSLARERVWPVGKRNMQKNRKGFSLVEMSIVMAILGVMVGIVMPSLVDSLPQRATQGAADRLTMAHSLARATAVRFGRVAELHIDAANARFWVEVDTSGTGIRDTLGLMNDLSEEQVTMSSDRSLLCFDARGLSTTRNACESGDVLVEFARAADTTEFRTTVLGKVVR